MLILHGAMLVAPIILLFWRKHTNGDGFCVCIFRRVFGVDCPGCGVTRSAMSLFAGDIRSAFHMHPGGPVVIALIALIVPYLALILFAKVMGMEWRKEVKVYTGIAILAAAALIAGRIGKT